MNFWRRLTGSTDWQVTANQLKLQSRWLEAGDAFCKAAELHQKNGGRQAVELIAVCLGDAANCFTKADPRYAILAMEAVASLRAQQNQFSEAAEVHENIADLAKKLAMQHQTGGSWLMLGGQLDEQRRQRLLDLHRAGSTTETGTSSYLKSLFTSSSTPSTSQQRSASQASSAHPLPIPAAEAPSVIKLAAQHYQLAADRFSAERLTTRECECLTKKAELLTEIGELEAAAQQFLELARRAQSHELLAFSAVSHVFKACLLRLQSASSHLGETQPAERLLADAQAACAGFSKSEEAVFVRKLAEAVRARDVAALDNAKRRFEKANSVNDFCKSRLGYLRRALSGEVQLT